MRKKQPKNPPMPKWIWQLKPGILKAPEKHLLSYIWYFGCKGCCKWNYYLAKLHSVSQSTIKRRLMKLHKLHLVAIVNPHYKRRKIYRLPYWTMQIWLTKKHEWEELTGSSQVSYIYYLLGLSCLKDKTRQSLSLSEPAKGGTEEQKHQGFALKPNDPISSSTVDREKLKEYKKKSGILWNKKI